MTILSSGTEGWDGLGMYCAWSMTGYQSKLYTGKCTITSNENQEGKGKNWMDNIKFIKTAWDEAGQAVVNREDANWSVAHGLIKDSAKA